jgi:hypothetical protein
VKLKAKERNIRNALLVHPVCTIHGDLYSYQIRGYHSGEELCCGPISRDNV